ncbi:hypothetical protein P3T36_006370 [Kitasatospora sp. MAP12-15]|uniref:hypothetical protein n=1 Tax=unclassified Kitasatospora TaxID=2633591 RepID=UPI0024747894|nr:hypothetical protein [Kitasatospora sp. MAP12-44]MDH6107911.1 hypothetical protein [Kitasatospora sp. MAP12-44]
MTVPTGFTTLYGLTIACCDEDGDAYLALGHHDPRRMTAAANRLLRTERLERYRPMVGELPRLTHTFGTLTEQPVDEDGEGGWSFEFASPDEAGAQAVTLLEVAGLGDFELLAVPSRCPDCSRLTTTGHYMSAKMRALSAPSPLGHECRICGAIWPGVLRFALTPAAAA